MSKAEVKLKSFEFEEKTERSFAEVAAACRKAAEMSSSTLTKFTCDVNAADQYVTIRVRRGGMLEWASCLVSYDEDSSDSGGASVSFSALHWMTSKPTVLFIPVGSEQIPATKHISKYSRALRAAL